MLYEITGNLETAAGVPAEIGLFSGFIGDVVTVGLSRCASLVSGPDAGIGALVAEMLHKHGVEALGSIVLIAGFLQLAIGFSKEARWFRAVSPAVVSGMLLGMGLLIIFSQFHIMLDDLPKKCGFAILFPRLLEYIPTCALAAILVFIGVRMVAEIKKNQLSIIHLKRKPFSP